MVLGNTQASSYEYSQARFTTTSISSIKEKGNLGFFHGVRFKKILLIKIGLMTIPVGSVVLLLLPCVFLALRIRDKVRVKDHDQSQNIA